MRALQAAGGGKKRAWFGLKRMPVSLEVRLPLQATLCPLPRRPSAPLPLRRSAPPDALS